MAPSPSSRKPGGASKRSGASARRPSAGTPGSRRRSPRVEEFSAGGFVLDRSGHPPQAALIARRDRRGRLIWSLPKGHIEQGETAEDAAVREIFEETGITGSIVGSLGTIDFWFMAEDRRIHKTVHHFLLEAHDLELSDADAEVTEVATRYKGRINAYQIWNEANLKNFWNGTPEEMAELTKRAYDIIKKIDPEALVVSASPSTRLTGPFTKFFPAYLEALAAKDWPIDVVAIHTYPTADGDPVARGAAITAVQDYLAAAGAPDLPLWDTELNYGLAGPGPDKPKQDITGVDAAGWIVRTYIDDLRYGVERSYWYIWTQKPYPLLGIQAYPGSDGEQGFFALENWVIGSVFDGCTEEAGAVTCSFTREGQTSVVAWAQTGEVPFTAPEGAQLVCDPLANCLEVTPGSEITLTEVPIRVFTQL